MIIRDLRQKDKETKGRDGVHTVFTVLRICRDAKFCVSTDSGTSSRCRGWVVGCSTFFQTEETAVLSFYYHSAAYGPPTMPYIIFGRSHNWASNGNNKYPIKINTFRIFNGNGNIRNYIPALIEFDSKPGLFDLCGSICPLTGTPFYVNAGPGEFLYGEL